MRYEIRIAGFGGQGVISIGVLLARAAGQFDGLEVAQTQSYGPEARGGACKTEIILSDGIIDYIKPLNLDLLAVMSPAALAAYAGDLKDERGLIVDSSLVAGTPARFTNVARIPATEMAEKELKQPLAANMVIFGALVRISGHVSADACKEALRNSFSAGALETNRAAFDLGYAYRLSGG